MKVGSSSLTTREGGLDAGAARRAGRRPRRAVGSPAARSCSSPPAPSPPGWRRWGCRAAPATSRPSRRLPASARACCWPATPAAFARHGLTVGQVLLTADDVVRRTHYANARRTLYRLLGLGVVPVVNENDTVATARDPVRRQRPAGRAGRAPGARRRAGAAVRRRRALRRAAARPGALRGSPLVRGPGRPRGRRRSARPARPASGLGGMVTKVDAAADRHHRRHPHAADLRAERGGGLAGDDVGTWFEASRRRARASRLLWLAHAARAAGPLVLDDGAVAAVVERRMSLLPAGVTRVEGRFSAGDPVDLSDASGSRGRPRTGQLRRRGAAGAARPLHPGPGPRARCRLRARGRPPRRPRRC